jgi:phage tail sheath protein FI
MVTEDRRMRLANLGVNTFQSVRSAVRIGVNARTLAAGAAANADWQYLATRRLALFIINSIERGTRWVATAPPHVEVAEAVSSQVRAFFESLHDARTFGDRRMQDSFFVVCDQRGEFHLVISFAAQRTAGLHTFRIVHSPAGSKIVPISLNRLNVEPYSPAELEWVERLARSLSD